MQLLLQTVWSVEDTHEKAQCIKETIICLGQIPDCIILINKFCSKRSHHDYEYLGTGELVLDVRWVCPLCYDFDKQMSLLQQSSSFSSWLWVFENRWIGLGCQVGVPALLLLLPDIVSHADNPLTAFVSHRMMEITFASMLTFHTKLLKHHLGWAFVAISK